MLFACSAVENDNKRELTDSYNLVALRTCKAYMKEKGVLYLKVIVSHSPNWVACFILLYYALLGGNVVQGETLIKYYLPTYLRFYMFVFLTYCPCMFTLCLCGCCSP